MICLIKTPEVFHKAIFKAAAPNCTKDNFFFSILESLTNTYY